MSTTEEVAAQAVIAPLHPFYPLSIEFSPAYVPFTLHPIVLLLVFFSVLAVWLALVGWHVNRLTKGKATRGDMGWSLWFGACAAIHLTFEGYFAFTHKTMPQSTHIEAQMWKMYALADSRYITSDSFTVIMEACTAIFWGPLSLLLAVYLIPSHSPFRHPTQFAVSLGQLYGLVLYWAIPIMNELVQGPIAAVSRPGLIFYWGEFVGLNAPWFFIPIWAIYASTQETAHAFRQLNNYERQSLPTTSTSAARKEEDEGLPFLAGEDEERW